jgi:hypothetical protein
MMPRLSEDERSKSQQKRLEEFLKEPRKTWTTGRAETITLIRAMCTWRNV